MANLDRVMDEIKSDEGADIETVEQNAPQTEQNEIKEEPKESEPVEDKPKIDKSKISDVDKATYSLKKQMAKQKARYERGGVL